MNWRSAFSVSGNGKSRTWRRFSSVNEVPVLVIKCYIPLLCGLAVAFFSRSLPSTLRVLLRYSLSVVPKRSTSSMYISHISVTYPANTTLKERVGAFESHGYSVPFKQSILSNESSVFLRCLMKAVYSIRMQRCLMITCSEVNYANLFRFQSPYAIDNLLNVGNGPSFKSTSGRVQSNKVKGETLLLRLAFRSRLGY